MHADPETDLPPVKAVERMNPAQRLTVLSVAIGVAVSICTLLWTVFGAQRDIQDLKRDTADHSTRLGAIEERARSNTRVAEEAHAQAETNAKKIAAMDEHGTAASQRGIYQESDFSHATEKRVSALEKTMADMAPKVERIDVNLQWMMRQSAPIPPNNQPHS